MSAGIEVLLSTTVKSGEPLQENRPLKCLEEATNKEEKVMYRVYRELRNNEGEVIHKTPMCRCAKLEVAVMRARVWSNGWPTGIYQLMPDGAEVKVQ